MSAAIILDTEATGKDSPEIVEAAYLELLSLDRPLVLLDEFVQRYRPTSQVMTFGALALHHIWPDELVNCPPSSTFVLPDGCDYIIGHSIDFDWKAIGSPNVKRICTHAIATHLWHEADAFSLVALVYMTVGKSARQLAQHAHGAYADAVLCKLLLDQILAARPEIQTWEQLWEYSEACRIPLVCPFKRYQGVLLTKLPDDFIDWCLSQHWIDPYLRQGLNTVVSARLSSQSDEDDEELFEDDWP